MKRFAVLGLTAFFMLASATTARAQLVMQMSNGWNFTFAGNVNAFYVEQWGNAKADGVGTGPGAACTALTGPGSTHCVPVIVGGAVVQSQGTNADIRTGLLPATVAFDAKGKEGDLLIDVHFGFYPE